MVRQVLTNHLWYVWDSKNKSYYQGCGVVCRESQCSIAIAIHSRLEPSWETSGCHSNQGGAGFNKQGTSQCTQFEVETAGETRGEETHVQPPPKWPELLKLLVTAHAHPPILPNPRWCWWDTIGISQSYRSSGICQGKGERLIAGGVPSLAAEK